MVKRKHFDSFVAMLEYAYDYSSYLVFNEKIFIKEQEDYIKELKKKDEKKFDPVTLLVNPSKFYNFKKNRQEVFFKIKKTQVFLEVGKTMFDECSRLSEALEKGLEVVHEFSRQNEGLKLHFEDGEGYKKPLCMLHSFMPREYGDLLVRYLCDSKSSDSEPKFFGKDWEKKKWYVETDDDYRGNKRMKVEWTE